MDSEGSEAADGTKLFVYNLAKEVTDRELQPLFAPFKPVYSNVALGKKGTSRRFGFVLFSCTEEAERARVALKGAKLCGKEIEIKLAVAPEPTPDKFVPAKPVKHRLLTKTKSADTWTIPALLASADFPPLQGAMPQQPAHEPAPLLTPPSAPVALPAAAEQPTANATLQLPAIKPGLQPPAAKPRTLRAEYHHDGAARVAGAAWHPVAHLHPPLQHPYGGPPPHLRPPPGFGPPPGAPLHPPPPAGVGMPSSRRVLLVKHGRVPEPPKLAEAFYRFNCSNAQLAAEGQSAFEFANAADAAAALAALNGTEVGGAVLAISMVAGPAAPQPPPPPGPPPPPRPPPVPPFDPTTGAQVPWPAHHTAAGPAPLLPGMRPPPPPPGAIPPPPAGGPPGYNCFAYMPPNWHGVSFRPPPPPGLGGPPPPQQRPGLLQVGHGVPFTAGGGSALRVSAPEFRPGSPSKPVQLQPLADAVSWINGAVMAAMEGKSFVPAWSPRAQRVKGTLLTICTPAGANFDAPSDPGCDWAKNYAALSPFNVELILVGRHLMRQLVPVEVGMIKAAPTSDRVLSVLKGALVRILVDGAYQLRLVVSTKLDGKQLQLLLNDMPHPIPADHISNTNPMDPGREGETIDEQGQRELLELHARLAFTGLRPKRSEVARVAWRLAAATKCSLEADKQAAEEELRRALEDSEGEGRLLAQVQAADVIEEAQILHAAFSLPEWREAAAWLPPPLAAEASPAAKHTPRAAAPPAGENSVSPGTQEIRAKHWMGELLAFRADERTPPTPECIRAAAANLLSMLPPISPLRPGAHEAPQPCLAAASSLDLASSLGLASLSSWVDEDAEPERDALISEAQVPADAGFAFRHDLPGFHICSTPPPDSSPDSCGFDSSVKSDHLEPSRAYGTNLQPVSKQLSFTASEGGSNENENASAANCATAPADAPAGPGGKAARALQAQLAACGKHGGAPAATAISKIR